MKRSIVMLGLLAAVAAGGVACSDETSGQATPGSTSQAPAPPTDSSSRIPNPFPGGGSSTTSTAPSGGENAGPLVSTDPCALSASAVALVNVGSGAPQALGEARSCRYQANGMTVDVAIYDELGLDDYVSSGGQVQQTKVGKHDALQAKEPPNLCLISMGTSASSRVDVAAGARGDQSKACQVATQVATALEPSLPG